jgi:potassium-dependent mechanosensitive channel
MKSYPSKRIPFSFTRRFLAARNYPMLGAMSLPFIMPPSGLRFRFAAIALLFMLLGFATASAQTQARLETLGSTIERLELRLAAPDPNDALLNAARDEIAPVEQELRTLLEAETPKRNAIAQRLKDLGDAPAANAAPESVGITREREEQQRQFAEIQDRIKFATLLRDRAASISRSIIDLRRARFANQLLAPSQSVLSPTLWVEAMRALPTAFADLVSAATFWRTTIAANAGLYETIALIGGLIFLFLAYRPFRRLIHSRERRDPATADPAPLHKALGALQVIIGGTLAPALIITLAGVLLKELGFLPGRLEGIVTRIEQGLVFLAFVRAAGWAVIPVQKPQWRLFTMSDAQARSLQLLMLSVATVLTIGGIVEAISRAVFAALPISVFARGLTALLVALLIFDMLRRARNDETQLSARLRIALFAVAAAIAVAVVFGYVALALFIAEQAAWIAGVLIIGSLVRALINDFAGRELSSQGRLGRHFGLLIGIRGNVIDQFGVVIAGVLRVALIVFSIFLILAPWGVDGTDLFGTLRAVFFGFTIGGVTISLSTVAAAIAVFVIGFFITRAAQRWLGESYLPHTSLDPGLRNSISTSFGYIGIIAAAVIALSQAGLSLDRLAIVAGALSVGIGFGLQSVVNNFVSGLILLWERPLKVGDWLEIGQEQGFVKQIRVRSTEIETFDQASLIVPNSEFISGRVKNWVHSNRRVRIVIPIAVSLDSDPRIVQEILAAAALAHRDVLSEPKSRVFFRKISMDVFEFELIVYTDADSVASTRNDLLHEITVKFREARITFGPKSPPAMPAASVS